MSFDYTPSQRRAIEDRGGAVLVSAAAGSGKTRVLTERLLRRVTDPEAPADIDRFLVITYTRAAAAELRDRIMTELGRRAAAHPEDRRLRRQQTLCCRAQIGTIHSFCTALLREHCHLLALPPTFTVLDEDRAAALRSSVLARLLDQHYERIGGDPEFRLLADTVGAGRDDRRLENTVQALYLKLRSQPWPDDWAARQKAALRLEGVTDVGETVWGRELLDAARAETEEHIAAMEAALREITESSGAGTGCAASVAATAEALRDFRRAIEEGWDRARAFAAIPFPRLTFPRDYDPERKGRIVAARDACKKAAAGWRETLDRESGTLLDELRATAPAMGALLDLALELDKAFGAEKLRRGVLDFSDLEHYAARLLIDRKSGRPTPAAAGVALRFEEVMVDEYQDVSPIQDLIFRAVSRGETNLFLVGDVKQSIYRFRLADPSLFLEKYHAYVPAERAENGEPRRILLQENFRSRKAVLDAANHVFSNLMSEALGELDYDADAALKYGAAVYPEGADAPAELVLIDDAAADGDETPPEKSELEARFVADRLLSMMNEGTPVYSPDGPRRCDWGDFALLLRSPNSRGAVFRRVLAGRGIPVQGGQGGGFFTSLEITVAVDLLSLVDNPHADVPLISVLRSPVFCFTPDELSAIRAGSRDTDYYTALRAAAEGGDGHCAAFLALLDGWRAVAPDLGLDALLWRICGDTDLFAVCAAMRDGEARRQNLMRLFEYARAFTGNGYRGVGGFVRWLHRLAESGAEPEPAASENAVKIMSIHRSKGLEFPFVFLCDLGHQFNKSDARESVLLHTELGLGPKYTDADAGIEYPTVARRAIERRMLTELLSEEMRVLYVAMTRARERLVMTATLKKAGEALEKLRPGLTRPVSPAALRAAPSPARWLALATLGEDGPIRLNVVEGVEDTDAPAPEADGTAAADDALYRQLEQNLAFVYPHAGSVRLPSRLTATELKRAAEAEEAAAEAVPLAPEETRMEFRRPALGQPRKLTGAERGTATHAFLQYLDFSKTDGVEPLRAEAERIAAAGHLSPEERDAIDFAAVARLFASPLGRAMRRAGELRREFRFTLLAKAADYFPAAEERDELLLQGVVDCFFVEDGEITVVDYKTDHVSAAGAAVRAERYRSQLETYAGALHRITGLPVRRCVLWFLTPGVEIEIHTEKFPLDFNS